MYLVHCANGAALSCDHLYQNGLRQNGVYAIDPDGQAGPLAPIHTNCTFDTGKGITVVHHSQEAGRCWIKGYSQNSKDDYTLV